MNSRTHGELVYCSIPVLLLSRSTFLFYVQNVLLISHELIACYSSSILMQKMPRDEVSMLFQRQFPFIKK